MEPLLKTKSQIKQMINMIKKVCTIALMGISIVFINDNSPSHAFNQEFSCGISKGVPTTFLEKKDGKKLPIIRWTSKFGGLTPKQRCKAVSRNFQKIFDNQKLRMIISGKINKQPVICAAVSVNDDCTENTVLFTLKPGSNPRKVLQSLLDKRALISGEIQNQNSEASDIVIDFETYVSSLKPEP
ncbi:hypothetical protein CAL7716_105800 (plasmid) [Calothrix sp. PCC 7716]|nr:hypothetical protein CAL7716_105800 [Calothrix sp. PCC 7716]